jgi:hypothetical protein
MYVTKTMHSKISNTQNISNNHNGYYNNNKSRHSGGNYQQQNHNKINQILDKKVKIFINLIANDTNQENINIKINTFLKKETNNAVAHLLCRAICCGHKYIIQAFKNGIFKLTFGRSYAKNKTHPLHFIGFPKDAKTALKSITLIKTIKWSMIVVNGKNEVPHESIFHNQNMNDIDQKIIYDSLTYLSSSQIEATLTNALNKIAKNDISIGSEVFKWCAYCNFDVAINTFIDCALAGKPPSNYMNDSFILDEYMNIYINLIENAYSLDTMCSHKIKNLCLERFFKKNHNTYILDAIVQKLEGKLEIKLDQLMKKYLLLIQCNNDNNDKREITIAQLKILFILIGKLSKYGSTIIIHRINNLLGNEINKNTIVEYVKFAAYGAINSTSHIKKKIIHYFKQGELSFPIKKAQIISSLIANSLK